VHQSLFEACLEGFGRFLLVFSSCIIIGVTVSRRAEIRAVCIHDLLKFNVLEVNSSASPHSSASVYGLLENGGGFHGCGLCHGPPFIHPLLRCATFRGVA
jgi:hypothetical protein